MRQEVERRKNERDRRGRISKGGGKGREEGCRDRSNVLTEEERKKGG